MKLDRLKNLLPSWKNALLAVLAAVLLILAFPDFEFWFLAWFALVPLLFAIERERGHSCPHEREGVRENVGKSSSQVRPAVSWGQECPRSFVLGWIFGNIFFFGTCWWLTYAPINYAGLPPLLAYFLLFCVTSVAAIFPGIFALILSLLLSRFGTWAFLLAPFVWVFTEFLRYWLTGNNWNAIGYSQAFGFRGLTTLAAFGGVLLTSLSLVWMNSVVAFVVFERSRRKLVFTVSALTIVFVLGSFISLVFASSSKINYDALVVAIQPNVPMAGLNPTAWNQMRTRHAVLTEQVIQDIKEKRFVLNGGTSVQPEKLAAVIFPESPMNFMYEDDAETRAFINGFAAKNNVSVLFNSAEPNKADRKYFNSAVLVGPDGNEVAQYDKIYLLPFGEAVPAPLQSIVPAFVGSFSYGSEYDLLPLGDAKAGVMICFESHFGQLSREYVRNGADVIIEMTNDGYLGPTPILRQHLANAVFRAVETNRPVLRVTNVGITAYINERGQVLDAAEPYTEATRVWSVSKSDGSQTFYVKYGDWFAWLCSVVTVGMLVLSLRRKHDR